MTVRYNVSLAGVMLFYNADIDVVTTFLQDYTGSAPITIQVKRSL